MHALTLCDPFILKNMLVKQICFDKFRDTVQTPKIRDQPCIVFCCEAVQLAEPSASTHHLSRVRFECDERCPAVQHGIEDTRREFLLILNEHFDFLPSHPSVRPISPCFTTSNKSSSLPVVTLWPRAARSTPNCLLPLWSSDWHISHFHEQIRQPGDPNCRAFLACVDTLR